MRDVVEGLLAAATGPTTLQTRLRRATRPVRRPGEALRAIRGVRTAFPRAVFGGALLDVLGRPLRELLAPEPPPTEDEAERRALTRRRASAAGASERRRQGVDERPSRSGRAVDWAGPGGSTRAAWAAEEAGSPMAGLASPGSSAPTQPARTALLDDLLRRYWQAAAAAELQRAGHRRSVGPGSRPSAPASGAGEPGPGSGLSAPASSAGERRSWAPMSEAELADELRAFVAERQGASEAEPGPRTAAQGLAAHPSRFEGERGPEGASGSMPASRPPAGAADLEREDGFRAEGGYRGAPLRDLADEMTEILREQAIRHGIDIA